jgi:hypothetical protein
LGRSESEIEMTPLNEVQLLGSLGTIAGELAKIRIALERIASGK